MRSTKRQTIFLQKHYNSEEEWDYLEDNVLKDSRSARVCMTCQHFNYCLDRHCKTILTCYFHQRLIPHGVHLTSQCSEWIQQLEKEIGSCSEAA